MTSSVQEIYNKPVVAPPTTAMSSFIDIHQVPNTSPSKVSMVKYSHARFVQDFIFLIIEV